MFKNSYNDNEIKTCVTKKHVLCTNQLRQRHSKTQRKPITEIAK